MRYIIRSGCICLNVRRQIRFLSLSVFISYIVIFVFSILRYFAFIDEFKTEDWVHVPQTTLTSVIDFLYKGCHVTTALTNFIAFYFLVRDSYKVYRYSMNRKVMKDLSIRNDDISMNSTRRSRMDDFLLE